MYVKARAKRVKTQWLCKMRFAQNKTYPAISIPNVAIINLVELCRYLLYIMWWNSFHLRNVIIFSFQKRRRCPTASHDVSQVS